MGRDGVGWGQQLMGLGSCIVLASWLRRRTQPLGPSGSAHSCLPTLSPGVKEARQAPAGQQQQQDGSGLSLHLPRQGGG